MSETRFADRPEDKQQLELGTIFAPKFDDQGVIPAIASDSVTGEILMFAWMNAQSLELTIETGIAHYWSRSREKLWKKGEESGNTQQVVELLTDCDQDVILLKVKPQGVGAACHNGYKSCFYRTIPIGQPASAQLELDFTDSTPLFDPNEVYKK